MKLDGLNVHLGLIGHAPHGACELKLLQRTLLHVSMRHAPHGACELKYLFSPFVFVVVGVTLPTERVS